MAALQVHRVVTPGVAATLAKSGSWKPLMAPEGVAAPTSMLYTEPREAGEHK